MFELLIGLLIKNGWWTQLQLLLQVCVSMCVIALCANHPHFAPSQYHVVDDSMPVAFQLMSISPVHCPAAQQLALDMLRRLRKFDVIVDVLLARGEVLAALRFVSDHALQTVDPKRFLDAAIDTPSLYFTVFRFFESCGYSAPPSYVQKFSKSFGLREGDNTNKELV